MKLSFQHRKINKTQNSDLYMCPIINVGPNHDFCENILLLTFLARLSEIVFDRYFIDESRK